VLRFGTCYLVVGETFKAEGFADIAINPAQNMWQHFGDAKFGDVW